jgi:hypothetical protein
LEKNKEGLGQVMERSLTQGQARLPQALPNVVPQHEGTPHPAAALPIDPFIG